jgi:hypothetical protein
MAHTVQTQHNGGEQGAASQAKDRAQEAAGQAQEKAQQVAGQARSKAREQVDQRSTQAGQRVRSQASDIRSVAEQLREQGKDQPAKVADQAADRIERVGSWLEQADAERMLDEVEDFARRQPWVVAVGAAAVGFAAARFLKASSGDRYERRFPAASGRATVRAGSLEGGSATGYGQGTTGATFETGAPTTRTGTTGTVGAPGAFAPDPAGTRER